MRVWQWIVLLGGLMRRREIDGHPLHYRWYVERVENALWVDILLHDAFNYIINVKCTICVDCLHDAYAPVAIRSPYKCLGRDLDEYAE